MNIIGVIPSRYDSTRFPGKPLKKINGKEMIDIVYENSMRSNKLNNVIVAAKDKVIYDHCKKRDINVFLTSGKDRCGTDAVYEVSRKHDADFYVNIQGDEPMLKPKTIGDFVTSLVSEHKIYHLIDTFNSMTICSKDDLSNKNVPKVVVNKHNFCIFMSRFAIPYKKSSYSPIRYKEIGLHAYSESSLERFKRHEKRYIEKAESIEFLRYIEYDEIVKMIYLDIDYITHAVDVPSDIELVEKLIGSQV